MKDNWLRDKLVSNMREGDVIEVQLTPTEVVNPLQESAVAVMTAYQNANKWMDSIKEFLLVDLGCVFLSDYIHNLAHTMPERFDKFGDILHIINMKVPYPATPALEECPADIPSTLSTILDILNAIRFSLQGFAKAAGDAEYEFIIPLVDELSVDISSEYVHIYKMIAISKSCKDNLLFDSWVSQYTNNMDRFID